MTVPLPITIHTVGHCQECGAIVHDEVRHFEWHAAQQPAPVRVLDLWEEALAARPHDDVSWEVHLGAALRYLSFCFNGAQQGDLVGAAAHIRAMAPEGTTWEEPWRVQQGTERNVLRSVIRSMVHADTKHGHVPEDATGGLVAAETYLHGLWLAAQEAG
jgi:hypothetical protein